MNKSELIDAIAARTELSKVASGKALDAVIESIIQAVAKGDGVSLVGFGSFKSAARAAREGKNPKTGEKIKIAATTVPKFSAGATFKAAVATAKGKKKKYASPRLAPKKACLRASLFRLSPRVFPPQRSLTGSQPCPSCSALPSRSSSLPP